MIQLFKSLYFNYLLEKNKREQIYYLGHVRNDFRDIKDSSIIHDYIIR